MNTLFKFGTAALAALALSSALTNSTAQGVLTYAGSYTVRGTNPDGSAYTGSMTMTEFGNGYRVTQNLDGTIFRGIASPVGDYLAVSFLLDGGRPGVNIYAVTAANTLSGYWQDYDNPKEGTETAVLGARGFAFVPSAPASNTWDYSGNYSIKGTDQNNVAYTANMRLSSYGDGYRAVYTSGASTYRGIATYIGQYLAIAWNFDGVSSVNIFEGNPRTGDMSGFWQDYNSPKEGLEIATWR
jgi:hypothetical protein